MSRTIKGSKPKDKVSFNSKRGRGFPWDCWIDTGSKKMANKAERRKNKVKPEDIDHESN